MNERIRDVVFTSLDIVGLLVTAGGFGVLVAGWITTALPGPRGLERIAIGAGLLITGLVILAGAWLAERQPAKKE